MSSQPTRDEQVKQRLLQQGFSEQEIEKVMKLPSPTIQVSTGSRLWTATAQNPAYQQAVANLDPNLIASYQSLQPSTVDVGILKPYGTITPKYITVDPLSAGYAGQKAQAEAAAREREREQVARLSGGRYTSYEQYAGSPEEAARLGSPKSGSGKSGFTTPEGVQLRVEAGQVVSAQTQSGRPLGQAELQREQARIIQTGADISTLTGRQRAEETLRRQESDAIFGMEGGEARAQLTTPEELATSKSPALQERARAGESFISTKEGGGFAAIPETQIIKTGKGEFVEATVARELLQPTPYQLPKQPQNVLDAMIRGTDIAVSTEQLESSYASLIGEEALVQQPQRIEGTKLATRVSTSYYQQLTGEQRTAVDVYAEKHGLTRSDIVGSLSLGKYGFTEIEGQLKVSVARKDFEKTAIASFLKTTSPEVKQAIAIQAKETGQPELSIAKQLGLGKFDVETFGGTSYLVSSKTGKAASITGEREQLRFERSLSYGIGSLKEYGLSDTQIQQEFKKQGVQISSEKIQKTPEVKTIKTPLEMSRSELAIRELNEFTSGIRTGNKVLDAIAKATIDVAAKPSIGLVSAFEAILPKTPVLGQTVGGAPSGIGGGILFAKGKIIGDEPTAKAGFKELEFLGQEPLYASGQFGGEAILTLLGAEAISVAAKAAPRVVPALKFQAGRIGSQVIRVGAKKVVSPTGFVEEVGGLKLVVPKFMSVAERGQQVRVIGGKIEPSIVRESARRANLLRELERQTPLSQPTRQIAEVEKSMSEFNQFVTRISKQTPAGSIKGMKIFEEKPRVEGKVVPTKTGQVTVQREKTVEKAVERELQKLMEEPARPRPKPQEKLEDIISKPREMSVEKIQENLLLGLPTPARLGEYEQPFRETKTKKRERIEMLKPLSLKATPFSMKDILGIQEQLKTQAQVSFLGTQQLQIEKQLQKQVQRQKQRERIFQEPKLVPKGALKEVPTMDIFKTIIPKTPQKQTTTLKTPQLFTPSLKTPTLQTPDLFPPKLLTPELVPPFRPPKQPPTRTPPKFPPFIFPESGGLRGGKFGYGFGRRGLKKHQIGILKIAPVKGELDIFGPRKVKRATTKTKGKKGRRRTLGDVLGF